MRLIDADKIIKEVYENPFVTDSVKTYVKCSVVEQPTIDAVPKEKYERMKEAAEILSKACDEMEYVVRCKDCKYYSPFKNGQGQCDRQICCVTYPDDYCSYGERGEAE